MLGNFGTGGSFGMQTMDSALADLVRRKVITRELAEARRDGRYYRYDSRYDRRYRGW